MSSAPRPQIKPSATSPPNGSRDHCWPGRRHDVDVALEQQRRRGAGAGQARDEVRPLGVGGDDRRLQARRRAAARRRTRCTPARRPAGCVVSKRMQPLEELSGGVKVQAHEEVAPAVAVVLRVEAERAVERERRLVVLVGVELDRAGSRARARARRSRSTSARPEAGAARLLAHEQVLEQAVLGRPPDAVAEAHLRDAQRRAVGVGRGEQEDRVRVLDQAVDAGEERVVGRPVDARGGCGSRRAARPTASASCGSARQTTRRSRRVLLDVPVDDHLRDGVARRRWSAATSIGKRTWPVARRAPRAARRGRRSSRPVAVIAPLRDLAVGDLRACGERRHVAEALGERADERRARRGLAGAEQRARVLRADVVAQLVAVGERDDAAPGADLGDLEPSVR